MLRPPQIDKPSEPPKDAALTPVGSFFVKFKFPKYEYGGVYSAEEVEVLKRNLADPRIRWTVAKTYNGGEQYVNIKKARAIEFIPGIA